MRPMASLLMDGVNWRTLAYGVAVANADSQESPEFVGPATAWAYTLSEFKGSVVAAERAIAQNMWDLRSSRGAALSCMMFS